MSSDTEQADSVQHSPYSREELAKHIDPILYNGLGMLQIKELTRVQLTVLFWDISDFSALCKDLYNFSDSITYFLDLYFKRAVKIVTKHHGVLDKFMGDGILAYFGYDRTVNGDPYNAVNAALEFRTQFPILKKQFAQYCKNTYGKDVRRIDLKCGINNGPAYVHYFNTPTRNSIIFLGSTLNFASRLEGLAKGDQIIVSPELRDMIQEKYEFRKKMIPKKDRIKSYEEVDHVYVLQGKREEYKII